MAKENSRLFNQRSNRYYFFLLVIVICAVYTTLRYVVFKDVSLSNFPLYLTNKIVSWAGITLIAISFIKKRRSDKSVKSDDFLKWAGTSGFALIIIHIFISLTILSPAYFPKFFDGEKLSFWAEASMLLGILAFFAFSIPAFNSVSVIRNSLAPDTWKSRIQIGYFGLLGTAAHTALMGYHGWLDIQSWPGYMPPITLLSTIIALIPLLLKPLKK